MKNEIASLKIEGITSQTETVGELIVLNKQIEADMGELVKIASNLTETGKADVVVIINGEGKIAGAASPKALEKGIKINDVIKEAAGIMDGGGGGKPNLAQGAGRDTTKIAEALDAVSKYLENIG